MPGLALLTIECLEYPEVTATTQVVCWTRLDNVEVILSRESWLMCCLKLPSCVYEASSLSVCLHLAAKDPQTEQVSMWPLSTTT